jgi:hypothetical protein
MTGPDPDPRALAGPGEWDKSDDWLIENDPVAVWRLQIEEKERHGDHAGAARLREAGPPPTFGPDEFDLSPVILAVEVGTDPGGAIAVAFAALKLPRLRLVIVSGPPSAARFARYLLDLLGRTDVTVVAGAGPSSGTPAIDGLVPDEVPAPGQDVLSAVRAVAAEYPYVLLWANCGPLTDLAAVYTADPTLAERITCTITVGPLDARNPHFASDPAAAESAFAGIRRPTTAHQDPRATAGPPLEPVLVTAELERHLVYPQSKLVWMLTDPDAPAWVGLLGEHVRQWYAQGNQTLSVYPAVAVGDVARVRHLSQWLIRPVRVDSTGRAQVGQEGVTMSLTTKILGESYADWIAAYFTAPDTAPPGP